MRINRLSPTHEGHQPIRTLQHNVTHQFESTNPTFAELSRQLMAQGKLSPGISYYISKDAIMEKIEGHSQTPFVDKAGKIAIHETFLSYVWCICYSMLVIHEEAIAKPSENSKANMNHIIDQSKIDMANDVFAYAKSLVVSYSDWNMEELPNPEYYKESDKFYVERANGLFVFAINFILCHEFAHVEQNHIKKKLAGQDSEEDILRFEKEADARAMELVMKGVDLRNKLTAEIGVLMGLASLLFLNPKSETTSHPATDDRMHNLILRANPAVDEPHWVIAVLAFKLWDDQFVKGLTWPRAADNYQELYEIMRAEIKNESK